MDRDVTARLLRQTRQRNKTLAHEVSKATAMRVHQLSNPSFRREAPPSPQRSAQREEAAGGVQPGQG